MLKTPPAFFTMYLIANIIFPKKTQIIAIWFLINQIAIVLSPTKMNFATFNFIVAKVIFLGGTPVKEFSQIQLFTTRILLEKIYHFLSILVSRDVFFKHYMYGHFET